MSASIPSGSPGPIFSSSLVLAIPSTIFSKPARSFRPSISYSFSIGHELDLGLQTALNEIWYARPNVNWRIVKNLSLQTGLFYEHGIQGNNLEGALAETYDWYGGSLSLSHAITKKLALSLNYRLTFRTSNYASREYNQNIIGLKLIYSPR